MQGSRSVSVCVPDVRCHSEELNASIVLFSLYIFVPSSPTSHHHLCGRGSSSPMFSATILNPSIGTSFLSVSTMRESHMFRSSQMSWCCWWCRREFWNTAIYFLIVWMHCQYFTFPCPVFLILCEEGKSIRVKSLNWSKFWKLYCFNGNHLKITIFPKIVRFWYTSCVLWYATSCDCTTLPAIY